MFTAPTALDLERAIVETILLRESAVAGGAIPDPLDELVAHQSAKDPRERPHDAHAVIEALEAILVAVPWQRDDARRWWQEFYAARLATA